MQTPSLNPDENLDLEEGETIYEDRWTFEWSLFWKLMFLTVPLSFYILTIQWYDNNIVSSNEYLRRFMVFNTTQNPHMNAQENGRIEKMNYWGKDLWYYSHWLRKGVAYMFLCAASMALIHIFTRIGQTSVTKMAFNRNKDVVFIWTPGKLYGRKLTVTELHHLEKPMNHMPSSWKYNGDFSENPHGYSQLLNTRDNFIFHLKTNDKYWNHDVKKFFDDNTTTWWKGNVSKDVNRSLFINNSGMETLEERETRKSITEEVAEAIRKHGPIQKHDYEHNFRYQLAKKLEDKREKLLALH